MLRRKASALGAVLFCCSAPSAAQEASRDRAELDAAAGRRVFENVLLADPQAFSSWARTRATPGAAVQPVATGEASLDREQLDLSAGRAVHRSGASGAAAPQERSNRPVRVILGSPYGR